MTTALGAADPAGPQSGLYPEPLAFAARWGLDRRFTAAMDDATRHQAATMTAASDPSATSATP